MRTRRYSNTHSHKIRHKVDADACEQFVYEMCHVEKNVYFAVVFVLRHVNVCVSFKFSVQNLCLYMSYMSLSSSVYLNCLESEECLRPECAAKLPLPRPPHTTRQRRHLCLSSVSFFVFLIVCRSRRLSYSAMPCKFLNVL